MPPKRKAATNAMGLADLRRRRNKVHAARVRKVADAAISRPIGVRTHRPPRHHPTGIRAAKPVPIAALHAVTGSKTAHLIARLRREAIAVIARPGAVRQ
tara:strand:- start:181 stop:477 length:297 start_codon:yes stop_codon:yes gene_type:complete